MALILIIALFVGGGGSAIREFALTHNYLIKATAHSQSVTIVATAKSDPSWGRAKVIGSRVKAPNNSLLVGTQSVEVQGAVTNIRLPLRMSSSKALDLIPGEKFKATGRFITSKERGVSGLLIVSGGIEKIRDANLLQRIASLLRKKFRKEAMAIGGDSGALIPGLVLGDTSLESSQFIADMRRTGLTHLTAVSGANFAIVAAFILWLAQWIFRKEKLRIVVTAFALIGFIFLVRPSPSVMRASVMSSVILIAKFRGVRASPIPSLALAIGLLLLIDPLQGIDPGFALSVAATAGILLLAPKLKERMPEAIAIPIAATILCTPIIILISGTLSLVSVPANILVAPVVAPITILGFIAVLVTPISPQIAHLILVIVKPFAALIVLVAKYASHFPVIKLPISIVGSIGFIVLVLIFRFLSRKIFLGVLVLCVVAFFIIDSKWPGSNWEVVNCNVGQGDAMVLNLGAGSAIVIDVGPDPKLIQGCLSDLSIKEVPLLVLTHFHADHVMGLAGLLKNEKVSQVWLSNYQQPKLEREGVLQALGAIPSLAVTCGQNVTFDSPAGNVVIKVLWPRNQIENFAAMPGDGSSINNSSVALDITIGKLRIFAPGDLEPPAQEELLHENKIQSVDILKVAHHGSAYQYLPLLDALAPKLALISVGLGNTYGHPSPKTLTELAKRGIKTLRTDLDGAIALDPTLRIRTKKNDWWNISWG